MGWRVSIVFADLADFWRRASTRAFKSLSGVKLDARLCEFCLNLRTNSFLARLSRDWASRLQLTHFIPVVNAVRMQPKDAFVI
jgi:hypothetical protein